MRDRQRSTPGAWTRRDFVRAAAGVLAWPHLPCAAALTAKRHFAYVAAGGDAGSIHVFSTQGNTWSQIQRVASRAPAHLLLSPSQAVLYVANEVELHDGLPRGTVEAFHVDPVAGALTLLGRTPLSLAATRPRHMALSPDGKLLAVAAYAGGIYNLLPVSQDGSVGSPCGIFKDAGCGADPHLQASAHPHTLLFDAGSRHLLSSDFGSEQISVFAIQQGRLQRIAQHAAGDGTGPGSCVLHSAGYLYAANHLAGTMSRYRYDAASGFVKELKPPLALPGSVTGSLALHPAGHTLYASDEQKRTLQRWQIDPHSGELYYQQAVPLASAKSAQLTVAADGASVYATSHRSGSITRFRVNVATGQLYAGTKVATLQSPRSVAFSQPRV